MQSCLTRYVFRHILQDKPLPHVHVQYPHYSLTHLCRRQPNVLRYSRLQNRFIFGFSRKPPDEPKTTDLPPGFGEMIELNTQLRMNARPPPPSTLVDAFQRFFGEKAKQHTASEELQTLHARITFQHLQKHNLDQVDFGLSNDILEVALEVLACGGQTEKNKERKHLAQLLFEELQKRDNSHKAKNPRTKSSTRTVVHFVAVLSLCGELLQARRLLTNLWQMDREYASIQPWWHILNGFCSEKNDEEILHTIEIMQKLNIAFDAKVHEWIVTSCARRGYISSVKKWYHYPIVDNGVPTWKSIVSVLRVCYRYKEFDWGQPIFQAMLEAEPNKHSWDVVFQWAAAKGKGVDEIERMMEVMVRRNKEQDNAERPDIETINSLIEIANSENDSYTAERYVSLAQKWKILPNAQTFLLQLDYRLKVGDLDGAKSAYAQLQTVEVLGKKDIPLINKLIQSLCKAKQQDYSAIMRFVDDLSERQARLEPDTTSALCLIHLSRNELSYVHDLLQTNAFHYDTDQRGAIRDIFVQFCLDRTKSNTQVWEAYSILRQIFVETSNPIRIQLMNEFFARKRGDMAMHVFGHMRQHPIKESRPDADAYTQCLEGIAKMRDSGSLEIIHNMLKLDTEVEPNTRLYNALMLGYTACREPRESLKFWEDIVYSREGPTYNSIQIALRACEDTPFGDREARKIWARLQRFDIEITSKIYSAYVGALAGHALISDAIQLIDDMETQIGCQPDTLTLGTLYNAVRGENRKMEVEEWAREAYPTIWQDLEKLGRKRAEEEKEEGDDDEDDYPRGHGPMLFNIDRHVSA